MSSKATPAIPNTLYGRPVAAETYYCDMRGRVWCVQSPDLAATGQRPARADLPTDAEVVPWREAGYLSDECSALDAED